MFTDLTNNLRGIYLPASTLTDHQARSLLEATLSTVAESFGATRADVLRHDYEDQDFENCLMRVGYFGVPKNDRYYLTADNPGLWALSYRERRPLWVDSSNKEEPIDKVTNTPIPARYRNIDKPTNCIVVIPLSTERDEIDNIPRQYKKHARLLGLFSIESTRQFDQGTFEAFKSLATAIAGVVLDADSLHQSTRNTKQEIREIKSRIANSEGSVETLARELSSLVNPVGALEIDLATDICNFLLQNLPEQITQADVLWVHVGKQPYLTRIGEFNPQARPTRKNIRLNDGKNAGLWDWVFNEEVTCWLPATQRGADGELPPNKASDLQPTQEHLDNVFAGIESIIVWPLKHPNLVGLFSVESTNSLDKAIYDELEQLVNPLARLVWSVNTDDEQTANTDEQTRIVAERIRKCLVQPPVVTRKRKCCVYGSGGLPDQIVTALSEILGRSDVIHTQHDLTVLSEHPRGVIVAEPSNVELILKGGMIAEKGTRLLIVLTDEIARVPDQGIRVPGVLVCVAAGGAFRLLDADRSEFELSELLERFINGQLGDHPETANGR